MDEFKQMLKDWEDHMNSKLEKCSILTQRNLALKSWIIEAISQVDYALLISYPGLNELLECLNNIPGK